MDFVDLVGDDLKDVPTIYLVDQSVVALMDLHIEDIVNLPTVKLIESGGY